MCQPSNSNEKCDEAIRKFPKGDEKAPENQWLAKFDLVAFKADIDALGTKLEAAQGPADVAHLDKIIMWSNACFFLGALTMWHSVNLFSIVMLSTFTFSRWTMIAHHTCHGGYDKVHPNKGRFNRFKFAVGSLWNRMCDWFDWMMPEAWNVEHNNRHHYCLSELDDPDLVENNLKTIRELDVPVAVKYLIVGINMMTWKWAYYAPNTYKELKLAKLRRAGKPMPAGVDTTDALTIRCLLAGNSTFFTLSEFITVVAGPYLLIHFFLMPAFLLFAENFAGVSPGTYYFPAVKNLFLAEILTNVHAFVAIVTNHAGDDMYRFREGCTPYSGSFYLRQVLASVDFSYGSDFVDFLHGWLNYQVEHHLWPNLSMLSYQRAGPLVKAICAKHGVPYVQQNVFWRVHKTAEIMVGSTNMRWFPEAKEKEFLKIDKAEKTKSSMTGSKD